MSKGSWYVKQDDDLAGPGNEAFAALAEQFPAVAWVLAGRPKGHEAGEMPPQTIMLFFDSGKLKFCFSAKHTLRVAFGTIEDASKPLECLEKAICEGSYEWKNRRR